MSQSYWRTIHFRKVRPRYIRAILYDYHFTTMDERRCYRRVVETRRARHLSAARVAELRCRLRRYAGTRLQFCDRNVGAVDCPARVDVINEVAQALMAWPLWLLTWLTSVPLTAPLRVTSPRSILIDTETFPEFVPLSTPIRVTTMV